MVLVYYFYYAVCTAPSDGINTKTVNSSICYPNGGTYTYECTGTFIPHGLDRVAGGMVSTCVDPGGEDEWSKQPPTCTGGQNNSTKHYSIATRYDLCTSTSYKLFLYITPLKNKHF